MANRSLQVKADRARDQRIAAGHKEYSKPIYIDGNAKRLSKPALRAIAASADASMVRRAHATIAPRNHKMVLYRPAKSAPRVSAFVAAMVACDGELVKRRDFRRA
jgi:hypothetical protein